MNHEVPWLRVGKGDSPADGGCIMQIVDWISTGGWSDEPACVHPDMQDVAVACNDHSSDRGRQKLLKLAPRMMGTANATLEVTERWRKSFCRLALLAVPLTFLGRTGNWAAAKLCWVLLHSMLRTYDRHMPVHEPRELDYSSVCAVLPAEHKREIVGVR